MRLDVVIPAHNEEHRIGNMLRGYRREFADPDVRFIVALDGPTDGTEDVVKEYVRRDPRVELLAFPKLGKGGVTREAFRHCEAELIGFVDADAATTPREFRRLVDILDGAAQSGTGEGTAEPTGQSGRAPDGVIASRRHPAAVVPGQRSFRRQIASAGYAMFVRALFDLPYADTQCGAKVFRRRLIDAALPLLSARGFEFDVELLTVARRLGFRVVEVPSVWINREGSRVRLISDGWRMAGSSLLVWLSQRLTPIEPAADGQRSHPRPSRT